MLTFLAQHSMTHHPAAPAGCMTHAASLRNRARPTHTAQLITPHQAMAKCERASGRAPVSAAGAQDMQLSGRVHVQAATEKQRIYEQVVTALRRKQQAGAASKP